MVRVLAVSDEVDEMLAANVRAAGSVDLIIACGDLPFEYLGHLMNGLDAPLVFVPGNHDPDLSGYRISRAGLTLRAGLPVRAPWPDGAVNADGRIVDVAGLRLAGLGGCLRYRPGPNQYSDGQQARRGRALARRACLHRMRDGRPVDVLLTHAPPRGVGDGDDPVHRGFTALSRLAARLRPPLMLHGHVSPRDVASARGTQPAGGPAETGRLALRPGRASTARPLQHTVVRNVVGRHLIDIEPDGGVRDLQPERRGAS